LVKHFVKQLYFQRQMSDFLWRTTLNLLPIQRDVQLLSSTSKPTNICLLMCHSQSRLLKHLRPLHQHFWWFLYLYCIFSVLCVQKQHHLGARYLYRRRLLITVIDNIYILSTVTLSRGEFSNMYQLVF